MFSQSVQVHCLLTIVSSKMWDMRNKSGSMRRTAVILILKLPLIYIYIYTNMSQQLTTISHVISRVPWETKDKPEKFKIKFKRFDFSICNLWFASELRCFITFVRTQQERRHSFLLYHPFFICSDLKKREQSARRLLKFCANRDKALTPDARHLKMTLIILNTKTPNISSVLHVLIIFTSVFCSLHKTGVAINKALHTWITMDVHFVSNFLKYKNTSYWIPISKISSYPDRATLTWGNFDSNQQQLKRQNTCLLTWSSAAYLMMMITHPPL